MSEWIKTENAIPCDFVDVIVCMNGKTVSNRCFYVSKNRLGVKVFTDSSNDLTSYGIDKVTHWMPLPEAPKE